MDSDGEMMFDGADSDGISDDDLPMEMDPPESSSTHERHDEDFQYEVLSADQIVQYMVDSIKEVNAVVQVSQRLKLISMEKQR